MYVSGTVEDGRKNWHKNQGIRRINQGSDGNWTEIGKPKVTDIDYNTVVPFYIDNQRHTEQLCK